METVIGPTGSAANADTHTYDVIINLANEGIPIRAINRAFGLSKSGIDVRTVLKKAIDTGVLCEMPKEDWPPAVPTHDRSPTIMVKKNISLDPLVIAHAFRTTKLQTAVLLVLLRKEGLVISNEVIHDAIENNRGNPSEPTSAKMVNVVMFHLRNKLKPFGITINTVSGYGYEISSENRAKIIEKMEA